MDWVIGIYWDLTSSWVWSLEAINPRLSPTYLMPITKKEGGVHWYNLVRIPTYVKASCLAFDRLLMLALLVSNLIFYWSNLQRKTISNNLQDGTRKEGSKFTTPEGASVFSARPRWMSLLEVTGGESLSFGRMVGIILVADDCRFPTG